MARFKVVENRLYRATYLIDAVDRDAAGRLAGDIVEEEASDSYGYDLISVEEVPPDATL